ncbi:hypothetical protein ACIQM0_25235 [Streptomyces sp. NPDC091387]|uniref:hypothetical protein n=1 Tax=Streptomyces sp. NPDC091387 TaxID=3365998 RepID=UPI0038169F21
MTGGTAVILGGGVLALVHAGNPDLSYLPLVTSLTGAFITVGGGAPAIHARRARTHVTEQADRMDVEIDLDHKVETATTRHHPLTRSEPTALERRTLQGCGVFRVLRALSAGAGTTSSTHRTRHLRRGQLGPLAWSACASAGRPSYLAWEAGRPSRTSPTTST